MSRPAAENGGTFMFQMLVIDPDPFRKQDPAEHWIGCDDEHEGEYSLEAVGGGEVVVTSQCHTRLQQQVAAGDRISHPVVKF
jgi:hypothetical protein